MAHRKIGTKRKKARHAAPTTPTREHRMFLLLRTIFKDPRVRYIENGYFGELPSPKGEPMQLDWYCEVALGDEVIRLAYEHQGRQHFKHNPAMMTKAAYRYLRRCDRLKAELCRRLGIALVHVRYDHPLTEAFLVGRLAHLYPEVAARLVEAGVLANLTQDGIQLP